MSSSSLTWSLMSKLVDDTWPRIPTDFTIHLVDEEAGEWEEGFQVLREPVQVEAHRMVLALVSPVLHALLYNNDQPPSSITLECSSGALTAVLAHIYGRQLEWARLTPTERDQVVSLGRQYQIVGLLEAAAVAEEELLDELFAVSLQTKLLSSEEEKTTTIPLDGQSDNVMKSLTNDTADSSVQLDNASSRKVSISLVENINNEAAENNSRTLDTDEDEDMTEADEATCENCDCIACKDGEVDCSDICAPDLQVVSGNREHIRVWRKAWLPGEIFPFCNLCPGRQGQPQEHHLLHPQLQLRGCRCQLCHFILGPRSQGTKGEGDQD